MAYRSLCAVVVVHIRRAVLLVCGSETAGISAISLAMDAKQADLYIWPAGFSCDSVWYATGQTLVSVPGVG